MELHEYLMQQLSLSEQQALTIAQAVKQYNQQYGKHHHHHDHDHGNNNEPKDIFAMVS